MKRCGNVLGGHGDLTGKIGVLRGDAAEQEQAGDKRSSHRVLLIK